MEKIKVIDSIMGSGKTFWCFNHMYKNKNKKYIYITPFLSEITRLVGMGSEDSPHTKHYFERRFREPQNLGEGKLNSLYKLLDGGYNIATTHTLFKMFDEKIINKIKENNYILILDEALEVVEIKEYSKKDYNMLIDTGKIKLNKDKTLEWLDIEYDGRHKDIMVMCSSGVVTEVEIKKKVKLLSWLLSRDFFDSFKDVYVMTYLFESSLLSFYFKIYGMKYDKYCIEQGELVEFDKKKPYNKDIIKSKIHIYEGGYNKIGDKYNALSYNWLDRNKALCEDLANNMHNFFQDKCNAKGDDIIWTTFIEFRKLMQYKGFIKRFIPFNIKATNEYRNCAYIAYCCNRYPRPEYQTYLFMRDHKLNQDLLALSELIQFLWRARIRNNPPEDIYVYLPSSRMRLILKKWLDDPNI